MVCNVRVCLIYEKTRLVIVSYFLGTLLFDCTLLYLYYFCNCIELLFSPQNRLCAGGALVFQLPAFWTLQPFLTCSNKWASVNKQHYDKTRKCTGGICHFFLIIKNWAYTKAVIYQVWWPLRTKHIQCRKHKWRQGMHSNPKMLHISKTQTTELCRQWWSDEPSLPYRKKKCCSY